MFGFVSRKKYEAAVAKAGALFDEVAQHVSAEEFSAAKPLPHKVALAVKRLDEARSNAFRNRQMILTLDGKLSAVRIELEHWRAYGQLRDPATGRLVPKAQTAAMLEKLGGEI